MGDVKLLPCPFCGAEATLQYNRVGGAHIFCSNQAAIVDCETESPTEADNDETFAAWNTRPTPALTPKQAAADELFDALKVALSRMAHSSPKCLRLLPTEQWSKERGNRDDHCECEIATVRAALAKAGRP